jgi:Flp pilus assembly protein TadG
MPRLAGFRVRRSTGQSVVEFALVLPLMVIILFAIVDFARIYTTMMSVESAAREAADYGTELTAVQWSAAKVDTTVAEMERRACVATSNLPDFVGSSSTCTNPTFTCAIAAPNLGTTYSPCETVDPTALCDSTTREPPCQVTVTLRYDFHLINPFHIDFFGVSLGVPSTMTFERDSTFAMTDIDLSTGP